MVPGVRHRRQGGFKFVSYNGSGHAKPRFLSSPAASPNAPLPSSTESIVERLLEKSPNSEAIG